MTDYTNQSSAMPPPMPPSPPQRRASGSVITPLVLIGLGALFLMRNLVPELPLLDYLAQYWPFILIVWGALRAIEILAWSTSGRRLPVYGISGGEWILAILLCIGGLGLHAARGFYTTWLPGSGIQWGGLEIFGQPFDYPVNAEAPTGATPRITIDGLIGNARISGGDVDRVTITGRNTVRSMDQNSADQLNEQSQLEIDGTDDEILIHANHTRTRNQVVSGDFIITVPRGASLTSRGRDADFDINDIDGLIDITSRNASMRLENIGGEVRLEVTNSDLIRAVNVAGEFRLSGSGDDVDLENIAGRVDVQGAYGGVVQLRALAQPLSWDGSQTDINAEAIPGMLRLTLSDLEAAGLTGPVRIESSSKDLSLNGFTGDLDLELNRGDITLAPTLLPNGVLGRMNVRVNAGNVELALPEPLTAALSANTSIGDVTNNFGDPIQTESNDRRGGTLRNFGDGPSLTVEVVRGNITVRKPSAGDLRTLRPEARAPETVIPNGLIPNGPPRVIEQ